MTAEQVVQHKLIRSALLIGVILLGAAAWYTTRGAAPDAADSETYRTLGLAFLAILVSALTVLPFLRKRMAAAAGIEQRAAMMIGGWALGEGTALFGGVIFLMTGRPLPFVLGVAFLIASFAMFPITEQS